LSCDSDAPKVGSGRSDWTGVVKVNRRKANRRKMRPYSTYILELKKKITISILSTHVCQRNSFCSNGGKTLEVTKHPQYKLKGI
jgi:hypothetical protein